MVDRGLCKFTAKANFAEAAGAKAVLIINNQKGNHNIFFRSFFFFFSSCQTWLLFWMEMSHVTSLCVGDILK
jgi:hypothetical protein